MICVRPDVGESYEHDVHPWFWFGDFVYCWIVHFAVDCAQRNEMNKSKEDKESSKESSKHMRKIFLVFCMVFKQSFSFAGTKTECK